MEKTLKPLKNRRGQNTVEYLLMLTVIVGVVLVGGGALKRYMPQLFTGIAAKITGASETLGGGGPF